ncbi:Replication factor C, subunit RFC4 [Exophiala xenobiotica]|nr:Replication factor C, subunit RFC4 [Exophiala xenobiotica]
MKLLTKEQEQQHYKETLKGGTLGGFGGLGLGTAGVLFASRRYAFFRGLTLPLRAFLITSAGTFGGIIAADSWSRAYEKANNPKDVEFKERQKEKQAEANEGKTFTERAMEFGRQERYKIVAGSWIASMIAAFSLVNRNKYLSGQQKLVQARVYAQFLTLGVLVASAAFEINDSRNETGRYETVRYVDPKDPEHKRMLTRQQEIPSGDPGDQMWKDMIKAEEDRIKEREEDEKRLRKEHEKKHHKEHAKKPKKQEKDTETEADQEQRSGGEADEKKQKSK